MSENHISDHSHHHHHSTETGAYTSVVILVSDRCFADPSLDSSGQTLNNFLLERGLSPGQIVFVPDEMEQISAAILNQANSGANLILTCGGTGLAPRDVTPEATLKVADRLIPGIPEAMRAASMAITNRACLSRAQAAMVGSSIVVNLPGSRKAAMENLLAVIDSLEHGLNMASGSPADCAGHYSHCKS